MPLPHSDLEAHTAQENITKHLIFLFDGTWNSAAEGNFKDITNVFRLNMAINGYDDDGVPQITFYMPGPGGRGILDKQLGGAFGQGIDQIIREAYVNLCCNYWPGDKVYFFGFSRGAVAAHALATMIARCGLLKADYIDRLSYVWKSFIDDDPRGALAQTRFVDPNVHPPPRIAFMGLFDSVLGRDYMSPSPFTQLRFDGHTLSKNVDVGIQLLSIDDNRRRFRPVLWHTRRPGQLAEQIWIPGVHGDVGGIGDPSLLSAISFLTMIERVKAHTPLSLDTEYVENHFHLLGGFGHTAISDERASLEMKTLFYRDRRPSEKGLNQTTHNVFFLLLNQNIFIRNKLRTYSAERLSPFAALDPSEGEWFARVIPDVFRALARTNNPRS